MADVHTKDFALATYWLKEGVRVIKAIRYGRDFEFVFDDPHGRTAQLAVDFVNSEEHKYDAAQRALKKMCQLQSG